MNQLNINEILHSIDGILNAPAAIRTSELRRQQKQLRVLHTFILELVEAVRPFDALYQPEGPISHWDREPDDRKIFGVNKASITLGDFRKLRALLQQVEEPKT